MATLPRNTFAAGDAIIATDMNTNFTNVEGLINDVLDGTESHGNFTSTGTASLATVNATGTVTAGAFSTTGNATAATFIGAVTGNVTGDVTGSSGSCTGNAATASKWASPTTLTVSGDMTGSVVFDGSDTTEELVLTAALEAADIPNLSANKITSDTLATARIPNLSANKITSDTLNVARIPDLNASKIDAGTFGAGNYTFPSGLTVNGLLDVSSQGKIEFGNSNDQIRYNDTTNEYQFWGDGVQMTRLGTSIIFDTSGGSVVALSPATGTGNDAEWVSYLGYYFLYRNSSTAAEKENISTDLGTHLTADMIDSVVPKMWNRITAPGIPEIGPIADEMDAVSPFLAAHGTDANDDQILTGVNKTAWMSLMTLAIQDLRDRMEAVEAV